jgi:hypothetical protein
MFPHRIIKKYTWTTPDGKTQNQIDHIFIDRYHSSILEVRSFRRADYDTNHSLGVGKVTGRLAVSKHSVQTLDVERLNLRKLSELEVRKKVSD